MPVEGLLEQRAWLRRLCVDLVGEDAADDLAQETFLAALRNVPADLRSARAWLRRVAARFANRLRVGDRRRRAREREAARPEAQASTAELLDRLQAQRAVAQVVAELEEPYRTVVLMHYVDGRSLVEIAAHLGVPASTVRTRLSRGRELARRRLRGTRAWGFVLMLRVDGAPVGSATLPAVASGAVLMSTSGKIITIAAAAAIVTVSVLFLGAGGSPGDGRPEIEHAAQAGTVAAGLEPAAATELAAAKRRTLGPDEPDETTDDLIAASGRVLDDRGRPVTGVPLQVVPALWAGNPPTEPSELGLPEAHSGALGEFTLQCPKAPSDIVAGAGYVTIRSAPIDPDALDADRFLVVARAAEITGVVSDPTGRPLSGVRVAVSVSDLPEFPHELAGTSDTRREMTETGDAGEFAVIAPATDQAKLGFYKDGYRPQEQSCRVTGPLRITLAPIATDTFVGQVVDASGLPIAGAHVSCGADTRTDALGLFELPWFDRSRPMTIGAPGHLALRRDFSREHWERAGKPSPMQFTLAGPPLSISGTVHNPDGSPAAGLRIALALSYAVFGDLIAEQVAAGRLDRTPADMARTAEDGSFRVDGLDDKDYRLYAYDPATLVATLTEPVAAGTHGVRIDIPSDAIRDLRARIVAPDGTPIPGVTVHLRLQVTQTMDGVFHGETDSKTDADGWFTMRGIPRREVTMCLSGEPIVPGLHNLSRYADQVEPVITVGRRCAIRILAPATSDHADVLMLYRAGSRHMEPMHDLSKRKRDHYHMHHWWQIGTASPVLSVTEEVVEAVYYKAGKVVKREKLELIPGQLNEIKT